MVAREVLRVLAAFGMVLVVVIGAWWFFNVYDTAEGRCGRGDLGACIVPQGQQPTTDDCLFGGVTGATQPPFCDPVSPILENIGNSI